MSSIFAMSDIHGNDELLEENLRKIGFPRTSDDILVLCGDYLGHSWEDAISDLAAIMDIQCRYPEGQVVVLSGNHEIDWAVNYENEPEMRTFTRWINQLPLFYETQEQIFVHAGIDESAGDLWKVGTPDDWFTHKFPADTGRWDDGSGNEKSKDIIAGHISVMNEDLGGQRWGACVYYDGDDHFFIDGTTERTGIIPILEYDVNEAAYYGWDESGERYFIAKR